MVHRDSDGASLETTNAGSLDLVKSEAFALAQLGVVLQCRATNGRTERLDGLGTKLGCFGSTKIASALLLSRLVEPDLDPALPILENVHKVSNCIKQ